MAEIKEAFIDIHCHIVPNVDDGAQSISMALDMITLAYNQGIRTMIATPHYEIGKYEDNQQEILENLNKLNELVEKKYPDFKIFLGNEVYYSYGVVEALDNKEIFTLASSRYVLVEFSPTDTYKHIREALYEIISNGYTPIVAHCERYENVMKDLDRVGELVDMGSYIQINSRTIAGDYGRTIRKKVIKLIKDDLVHFIATDAHSNGRRSPVIDECIKYLQKKTDVYTVEKLLNINPRKVLNNEDISE